MLKVRELCETAISMPEVDKEKLAFALGYPPSSDVKVKHSYWGQCLDEGIQPLKSLHVSGIKSSVSIPISSQVGHYFSELLNTLV